MFSIFLGGGGFAVIARKMLQNTPLQRLQLIFKDLSSTNQLSHHIGWTQKHIAKYMSD